MGGAPGRRRRVRQCRSAPPPSSPGPRGWDHPLRRVETGPSGGGAGEGGVTEVEDAAVGRHHPVALAVGRGRHAHDGLDQVDGSGRTVEGGVAEAEDPAVGRHQPVALAVGRRRHAHDGLVQGDGAGRAVEGRVAVGEDAAVGRHQPVALAVGRRRHAHDGLVQHDGPGRAVEGCVAVGEDAAIGGHEPVALLVLGGGDGDDRVIERQARRRTEGAGVAEVPHGALGVGQPVVVRRDAGGRAGGLGAAPTCRRRPPTRSRSRGRDRSAPRSGGPRGYSGEASREAASTGGRDPRWTRLRIDAPPRFPEGCTGGGRGNLGVSCVGVRRTGAAVVHRPGSSGRRSALDEERVAEGSRDRRQGGGPLPRCDDHLGPTGADIDLGGTEEELLLGAVGVRERPRRSDAFPPPRCSPRSGRSTW